VNKSSIILPLVAAGAAVAVVAGVVAVGSVRNGSGAPAGGTGSGLHPLRIGAYPQDVTGANNSRYVLRGTLPTTPTTGIVWRVDRVSDSAERTAALAKALGLTGAVTRDAEGWTVRDGNAQVRVYDTPGSPWGYAADVKAWGGCAPIPPEGYRVSGAVSSCAIDGTATGAPSSAQVRSLAGPVLAAVGLTYSGSGATGDGPLRSLSVDPTVDGFATTGFTTTIEAQSSGVVMAGGWLAPTEHALTSVGTYPLRSAKDAFDGLQTFAVPEIACAPTASCPVEGPVDITGATYGLQGSWEDGTVPLLVPSWSFLTTAGDVGPVQGAVARRYVINAQNDNGDGGAASSPGSTGGGTTGSVEPPPVPTTSVGPPYGITSTQPIPIPSTPVESR
jgi:hypothetical protein